MLTALPFRRPGTFSAIMPGCPSVDGGLPTPSPPDEHGLLPGGRALHTRRLYHDHDGPILPAWHAVDRCRFSLVFCLRVLIDHARNPRTLRAPETS